MLRLETETGWCLVTHPDHARLAGAVAEAWGNAMFRAPEPRDRVLLGVRVHDDGWAMRDAEPSVTKQGKPAAFSVELVGKYSAFEEIDLQDYLNVRERAVAEIAAKDAYAALLVSKHTFNLLTERADRATIAAEQLPLLDSFLERQKGLQERLFQAIRDDDSLSADEVSVERVEEHFRLLQAADNMSLLACVNFTSAATLLHPLPLLDGGAAEVKVTHVGERAFRLSPYPLREDQVALEFPARQVRGKIFRTAEELRAVFAAAPVERLTLRLSR